jgi:hypothetical protein
MRWIAGGGEQFVIGKKTSGKLKCNGGQEVHATDFGGLLPSDPAQVTT